MGRLYVARHPTLQRDVVLKTLSTRARRHSTTAIARLKREAEILAKLAHDGICPVLDQNKMQDYIRKTAERIGVDYSVLDAALNSPTPAHS